MIGRTSIACGIAVVCFSLLEAIPHRKLDWDGVLFPLIRKYAEVKDSVDGKPLTGKSILITGCTSGIGLSLTRILTSLGASVIGVARNPKKLQSLRDELPSVVTVQANLDDLAAVSKAADEIISKHDHIDIIVNNAGIHDSKTNLFGKKSSKQDFDLVFATNYLSHFLLAEKLAPVVVHNATKRPTLVQISSSFHFAVDGFDLDARSGVPIAARVGGSHGFGIFWSQRSYANSKLAQIYHARYIKANHPLWSKARVVSVCPGWVGTAIGGEEGSFAYRLMQFGYPVDGWGVASTFLAMFDTEDHDYYINSRFFMLGPVLLNHAGHWMYTCGIRDVVASVFASLAHRLQKFFSYAGPALSSKESYDELVGESLYAWSTGAVKAYLGG